ncbi:MAG: SDR family oxidoreductase [Phycisphaerae bacterium]
MNLSGKAAMVTGAAKRIGREVALTLARAGCDVIVHYGTSAPEAASLAAEITALGRRAMVLQAHLDRPADLRRLAAAAQKRFGRVDVLVNNASSFFPLKLGDITPRAMQHLIAVNTTAPLLLSQAILPGMKRRRFGKIINLLDISVERPWPGYMAYCASKAALWSLTQSLAIAAAPHVQVNGICPGAILWHKGLSKADIRRQTARIPAKRRGGPQDIAAAVVYLCQTDYVTGQKIVVDGGRSATW